MCRIPFRAQGQAHNDPLCLPGSFEIILCFYNVFTKGLACPFTSGRQRGMQNLVQRLSAKTIKAWGTKEAKKQAKQVANSIAKVKNFYALITFGESATL